MKNTFIKFIFILSMILVLIITSYSVYKLNFERRLESRDAINEIVNMRIDTCTVDKYANHVLYEFSIADKYRVEIDSSFYEPFISKEKVEISIKNRNSDYILIYNNKFTSTYVWQSDIDKLVDFLKTFK